MDAKQFFYSFGKAFYGLDSVYDDFARKSNVAPNLMWILYALNDGEAHTQKDICCSWQLPKSTVNTIVGELKHEGFAELVPVKGTRREMTVVLTAEGKVYAENVLAEIYRKEAEVFAQLSAEEKRVTETMSKMVFLLKNK